ncbi:dephospho-CoA kinase [Halobacteriovorax sp.]|uniref:dephospho-CoA kinase n=1 Tax=Halobacteriovorax sp. TaxID=2020862 RepID=UPI003562AE8D
MKLKEIFVTKTSEERLYKTPCPVIGLTGGIATGKSTVSNLFTKTGVHVICADKLVKTIYSMEETLNFIQEEFPDAVENNLINFKALREIAFKEVQNKEKLENFIYKRLPAAYKTELAKIKTPELIIYDVPLLFEKSMEHLFDLTICVYAKREVQIERIIKRDNSSKDLAEKILDQQFPIDKKKELSDFCINNNNTIEKLEYEFEAITSLLMED